MLTYYLIYAFLLLTTIFERSNHKSKKVVLLFWCLFFTFFGGLRWQVGTDWDSYYDIFLTSDFKNIFTFDRYGNGEMMEPAFIFFNALVRNVFGQFFVFNLFACAFLQFSFYKSSLYFAPRTPLIFYSFLILFVGFFPIRATIGMAIAYWGFKAIKEQNFGAFIISMVFMCSMHMKFIIFAPCYWFGRIKLKWYLFYIIYLSAVVLYTVLQEQLAAIALLFDNSMSYKFLKYTNNETEGYAGLNYIGVALNIFLMSIYLYFRKTKLFADKSWYNAILNMYLIGLCITAVFADGMGDLARLATLFTIPQALLLVSAIDGCSHNRNTIVRFGAVSFFIVYFIYRTLQSTGGYYFKNLCVPYMTIFDYIK